MSELDTQINRSQLVKQELEKLFVVKRSTDQENNLLRKCDGPTKSKSFSASSTHQSAGVCSLRSTTPPVVPPRPSPETMNLVNAEFNLIRNSNQVKVEETGEVQHRSTAKPPVPKKPANLARSAQLSNLDTSCTSSTESFVTATGSEWPDSSSNSVVSNSEKSLENSFDEEEKTPVVDVKDFPAGPIYEPLVSETFRTSWESPNFTFFQGGNEPNSPYPTVNKSGVFDTLNKFPWKRKNAKKVTRSKTLGNMGSLDSGGESDRPSSELAETDDTCNSPGKSVFYMTKEDRSLSNDSSEVSLQRGQLRQTFSAGQSAPSVVSATSNQSGTFKYPPPGDFFYRVSRQQKKKTTRTAASLEVPSSCLDRLNLTEGGGAVLRNKTRRSSRGKPKGRRPSAPVLTRSLSDSYVRRKSYRQMTSDISERPWSSKNSGAKRTSSYESSLYRDSSGYNSGLHESSSEESEMEEAGSENGVLEVKTAVEVNQHSLFT